MVLGAGLEPARIAPHAPQACVSANFTTRARRENGEYNTKIPYPSQGGIFRVMKVLVKSQKMMVQFPHFLEEKARCIMNTRQTFFLLGLGGLLAGCVTPTDMGYVTPVEPVYNSSPAYYATPVSGYSTMTVYDGYHPGYGGPRYPHDRPPPPPAYGHGHHGGHGGRGHGEHGAHGGHGAPARSVGVPEGTHYSSGSKRVPINQLQPPSRKPASGKGSGPKAGAPKGGSGPKGGAPKGGSGPKGGAPKGGGGRGRKK